MRNIAPRHIDRSLSLRTGNLELVDEGGRLLKEVFDYRSAVPNIRQPICNSLPLGAIVARNLTTLSGRCPTLVLHDNLMEKSMWADSPSNSADPTLASVADSLDS